MKFALAIVLIIAIVTTGALLLLGPQMAILVLTILSVGTIVLEIKSRISRNKR